MFSNNAWSITDEGNVGIGPTEEFLTALSSPNRPHVLTAWSCSIKKLSGTPAQKAQLFLCHGTFGSISGQAADPLDADDPADPGTGMPSPTDTFIITDIIERIHITPGQPVYREYVRGIVMEGSTRYGLLLNNSEAVSYSFKTSFSGRQGRSSQ